MRKKGTIVPTARERAVMAWPHGSKTIYQTRSPKGSWFYCAAGVEEEEKFRSHTDAPIWWSCSLPRALHFSDAPEYYDLFDSAPVLHLRGCRCQWKSWPGASKVSFVRVSPAVHLATHAGLISNHIHIIWLRAAVVANKIEFVPSRRAVRIFQSKAARSLSRGWNWKYLQPFLAIVRSGTFARQERYEKSGDKTYSQWKDHQSWDEFLS
jgi:hypothetical protein